MKILYEKQQYTIKQIDPRKDENPLGGTEMTCYSLDYIMKEEEEEGGTGCQYYINYM